MSPKKKKGTSLKQLTLVSITIGVLTLLLVVELSEAHVTERDLEIAVAFVSGASLTFAYFKAGD